MPIERSKAEDKVNNIARGNSKDFLKVTQISPSNRLAEPRKGS